MSIFGLDVLAIRHLSRQLAIQSNEVSEAIRKVNRLIDEVPWKGNDRDRFAEHWQRGIVPRLHKASTLLKQASDDAFRSAEAQERTSRT